MMILRIHQKRPFFYTEVVHFQHLALNNSTSFVFFRFNVLFDYARAMLSLFVYEGGELQHKNLNHPHNPWNEEKKNATNTQFDS